MKIDSRLQRREGQFVAAQRPKQRFAFQRADKSFFPGDDSRLWTAEQFVAAEADEIGSIFQRFGWSWLVLGYSELFCCNNRAASQIFHERDAFFSRKRSDLRRSRRLNKTAHEKIAAMNLENQSGVWSNGSLVIIQCGFIRGADFAQ